MTHQSDSKHGNGRFMWFFKHPKFGIQIRLENSMKIFIFGQKCFSNASKKFFMSPTRMFKVSRGCVLPSSLRRKKNESHPTNRSKYFWKKTNLPPERVFGVGVDNLNESLTRSGAT